MKVSKMPMAVVLFLIGMMDAVIGAGVYVGWLPLSAIANPGLSVFFLGLIILYVAQGIYIEHDKETN